MQANFTCPSMPSLTLVSATKQPTPCHHCLSNRLRAALQSIQFQRTNPGDVSAGGSPASGSPPLSLRTRLLGAHSVDNIAAAMTALDVLEATHKLKIEAGDVEQGLLLVRRCAVVCLIAGLSRRARCSLFVDPMCHVWSTTRYLQVQEAGRMLLRWTAAPAFVADHPQMQLCAQPSLTTTSCSSATVHSCRARPAGQTGRQSGLPLHRGWRPQCAR